MNASLSQESGIGGIRRHEFLIPAFFALARVVLHFFSFSHYGYFRDELYYIACSKHLAWGYVDQPPLSLFLLRLVRATLGDSLFAIRLLPLLAGIGTIFLASALARKLGGGRFAQGLAAGAALASPAMLLLGGGFFSMNSFDVLFWALAAWMLMRIVIEERPRLWLAFGAVAGLGLLNKYSMAFFLLGMGMGLLLSRERRQFIGKWIYLGGAVALLLFLPHLLWELKAGFPTLEFMRHAAQLKNAAVTPLALLLEQFLFASPGGAPLLLLGLGYFLFHPRARAVRLFGWMYLSIFALMAAQNGKAYYLAPFFPILFAAGAVSLEQLAGKRPRRWLGAALAVGVAAGGAMTAPLGLPLLPPQTLIRYQERLGIAPRPMENSPVGPLPQYFADMFGWEEMTAAVAGIFGRLTATEKADCLIYLRNYGQAGAIDFFGPEFGLPGATCAHNSYWFWGPGKWNGTAAIIFGSHRDVEESLRELRPHFESVELAGFTECDLAMPYENHRPIFLCRGAKFRLADIWEREKSLI